MTNNLYIQGWQLTAFMGHDSRTTPEDAVRQCGPPPTDPDMSTWRNQQAIAAIRVALQKPGADVGWGYCRNRERRNDIDFHLMQVAFTVGEGLVHGDYRWFLPLSVPDEVLKFQWPSRDVAAGEVLDVDMGDIPDKWFWRAQLAMWLGRLPSITIVVAGHQRSPLMFRLHADEEAADQLREAAGRMGELKRTGKLTDDVRSPEFKRDKDAARELTTDDIPMMRALVANAEAQKRLENERAELVSSLKLAVGNGGRVTFRGVDIGKWTEFETKPRTVPAGRQKRFNVAQTRTLAKLVMADDFQASSEIMRGD